MKKILSSILISFVVFANLFAPFSVLINNNKIEIKKNIISAADGGIELSVVPEKKDTEIKINVSVKWYTMEGTSEGVRVRLKDDKGVLLIEEKLKLSEPNNGVQNGSTTKFIGLEKNTVYNITTEARQVGRLITTFGEDGLVSYVSPKVTWNFNNLWNDGEDYIQGKEEKSLFEVIVDSNITTEKDETQAYVKGEEQKAMNLQAEGGLPHCELIGGGGVGVLGCIAQAFYYVFFVPTSYLFALAGVFFDNTFAYSVQSSSYKSTFVEEGWGLIRDVCNMFFIFILLYVAIGTILNLHSVKTKETIINIIIIGLFINFSLFATRVIIDTSNVMARVFYNSDAIKIEVKGSTDNNLSNATNSGVVLAKEGEDGIIPLSMGLVDKVNPQKIIIGAKNINTYKPKGSNTFQGQEDFGNGIGPGTFILLVILASAVNIVGFIVFLTVGLIFVTRVIGLWLAMIISPLAFFTYILPEMSGIKMIGWKNWWPETLKLAFLAPIFIFFLYLILKFLELDLFSDLGEKGGLDFLIAILIPFAFIMILLTKAKSIAVDMSGEMGQQITGTISAVGGMALGGAALGAAALGRGLITNPSKMMMSSQTTRNAALKNFSVFKPSTYGKATSAVMGNIANRTKVRRDSAGNIVTDADGNKIRDAGTPWWIKRKISDFGKSSGDKNRATKLLDAESDKISPGSKFSDLSAAQQTTAKTNASKQEIAKKLYKKDIDKLTTTQITNIESYIDPDGEVKGANKDRLRGSIMRATNNISAMLDSAAVAAGSTNFASMSAPDQNKIMDQVTKINDFNGGNMEKNYNTKIKDNWGASLSAISKGSYDVRNIKMDGVFLSPIAGALKLGLSSLGTEVGTAQGDFLKDLKSTLSKSFEKISKSIKVDVKIDHKEKGEDDKSHAKVEKHH